MVRLVIKKVFLDMQTLSDFLRDSEVFGIFLTSAFLNSKYMCNSVFWRYCLHYDVKWGRGVGGLRLHFYWFQVGHCI